MSLPNFHTFALQTPLYEVFSLKELMNSSDINAIYIYLESLRRPSEPIDIYCIECNKQSTFRLSDTFKLEYNRSGYISSGENEIFMVELSCTREPKHKLYFIFKVFNASIIKIGQHQSIADIDIEFIKKYKKVLSNDRFNEFSKAIGLVTHGIGIGSFVYLRRIFEGLIYEAYENIKSTLNKGEFQSKRMEEKIELLKPFLPQFLVDNKNLYSILSLGIHSLTEKDCLNYFNTVKIGIELILDEKLEELHKKEKIENIKKSLGNIASEIKK